jgi:cystathionine beta-lyase family protein involved in aluminum resistance
MFTENILSKQFGISETVYNYVQKIEKEIKYKHFENIDKIREKNQYKVIRAMQENRLNYTNFYWNTGYGYDDPGREKVDPIPAEAEACAKEAEEECPTNAIHVE